MGELDEEILRLEARLARVEIILKLAERCNINCSYCYYFEGNADRFVHRPPLLLNNTLTHLSAFLRRAIEQDPARTYQVVFHGGEPLLIGKRRFAEICERLLAVDAARISLCLQTNAILIDDSWIELFCRYNIGVSTSLDGPKHVHDLLRVDKKGRGTYDRTFKGIALLRDAARAGRLPSLGCLIYVDPNQSGGEIYHHVVHELGISVLDFLLPDTTHDTFKGDPAAYARYMTDVFDIWWKDRDPSIHLRMMKSVASLLVGGRSYLGGFGGEIPTAFTVSSDGGIELDDFLRTCGDEVISTGLTLERASLEDIVQCAEYVKLSEEAAKLPESCFKCEFAAVCRGGQVTHRYKKGFGFSNKSVYCHALYTLFEHAARALVSDGVPIQAIARALEVERSHGASPRTP